MTYHSSGTDRFRDLAGGDARHTRPPILYRSGELRWSRLRVLARRIVGFLASQRVAVAASRIRRPRCQQVFYGTGYGRASAAPTANRSRP